MSETSAADEIAQRTSSNNAPRKSEELFKNIQVLTGVPSNQLIPAMEFVSSSLGVECGFCHVEGRFDKDDKRPKQTARAMMRMVSALNRNSFEGHREVTCYSCHRGSRDPVGTPIVEMESQPSSRVANSGTRELPTKLPPASQLLERYIQALGGSSAIEQITSRVQKGVEKFGGESVRMEIFTQAPGKQTLVRHLQQGDSLTVVDGQAGWFVNPGRPLRDMNGPDLEAARTEADLQFPLHIRQLFPDLRVEYPEEIGGRKAYLLFCIREGHPVVKLYFDEKSGLLVRLGRYSESALGLEPARIDYADYRNVDGVQVPFRVTFSQPGNRSTIQFDEVRQNVFIDDRKFSKPSS